MKNVSAVLLLWFKFCYNDQALSKNFDGITNLHLSQYLCMDVILKKTVISLTFKIMKNPWMLFHQTMNCNKLEDPGYSILSLSLHNGKFLKNCN